MSERMIARTVAEAQVGDLLWRCSPQQARYDENRNYLGRGVWGLSIVNEVGRQSVIVAADKYDRQTGERRNSRGYSGLPYVKGADERVAEWWLGQAYRLADQVRLTRDIEQLKTVAFALGIEGPPDFSKIPEASHAR